MNKIFNRGYAGKPFNSGFDQLRGLTKSKYFTAPFIGKSFTKIVRSIIIIGLCYIILYPFFIKFMNGFKTLEDFLDPTVRFIPKNFTFAYIKPILDNMNYLESFFHTAMVSLTASILQVIVCLMCGYGFARFKFPLSNIIFFVVILTLVIPPQATMLPLYIQFSSSKLINTLFPTFILSATGLGIRNGLYIFMFRQFFRNIPKELEEAAFIDGCSVPKTFVRVMIPSAVVAMSTVFLLSFSWQWTDTFYSSLFFRDFITLATSIDKVSHTDPALSSAWKNFAALMAIAPLAIVYMFGQKMFVQSVERTGIVG